MKKKIYKQPHVKAIELEIATLLAGSDPTVFTLEDEEVEEYKGNPSEKPEYWGTPW